MPRLGVWAGRVEGRVVSSPSEVVSGPQSCESEASEAAKAHRHSHSGMRMCPHPYKHTCTQIHTQTGHTHAHTLSPPMHPSVPGCTEQGPSPTCGNDHLLPRVPCRGDRLFLCRLALGHSEGSTRLPQPSRAPSPPRQPLLS